MSRKLDESEHWHKCENPKCGRYFIVQVWKHGKQRHYCTSCYWDLPPKKQ